MEDRESMEDSDILTKVNYLIRLFLEGQEDDAGVERVLNEQSNEDSGIHTMLYQIWSDSIQAIHFVTMLEDEFDIEFDDDEIDMDFFLSPTSISRLIEKHKLGVGVNGYSNSE